MGWKKIIIHQYSSDFFSSGRRVGCAGRKPAVFVPTAFSSLSFAPPGEAAQKKPLCTSPSRGQVLPMGLRPPQSCPHRCPFGASSKDTESGTFFGAFCSVFPLRASCWWESSPTASPAPHSRTTEPPGMPRLHSFSPTPRVPKLPPPPADHKSPNPGQQQQQPAEGKTTPLGHKQPPVLPTGHLCRKDMGQSPVQSRDNFQEGFWQPCAWFLCSCSRQHMGMAAVSCQN